MSDIPTTASRHRQKQASNTSASILKGPAPPHYEAYGISKGNRILQWISFRPVDRVWERANYHGLVRIADDCQKGKVITLVFHFLAVVIRGRNLQRLPDAVQRLHCEYIQQFDPSRWAMPPDDSTPFVESIEYLYPTNGTKLLPEKEIASTPPPPSQ